MNRSSWIRCLERFRRRTGVSRPGPDRDTSVSALPNSSAVNIALAKKSKITTGSEMPPFFAAKLKANGGDPANWILTRFGGSVTIGGVRIATVAALHSNGVDPGDGFTTGPLEAAYVINELVKPASVIASHTNEVGTVDGKVRPGRKTEAFVKAIKWPVHIPLSGKTMESTPRANARRGAEFGWREGSALITLYDCATAPSPHRARIPPERKPASGA